MTSAWTIKDRDGELSAIYVSVSKADLERRIVSCHYNDQALREDWRYRAEFDRDLQETLEREGWQMVPIRLVEEP